MLLVAWVTHLLVRHRTPWCSVIASVISTHASCIAFTAVLANADKLWKTLEGVTEDTATIVTLVPAVCALLCTLCFSVLVVSFRHIRSCEEELQGVLDLKVFSWVSLSATLHVQIFLGLQVVLLVAMEGVSAIVGYQ